MSDTIVSDRRASWSEVKAHGIELRRAAARAGLANLRLRDDGSVIVHSPDPGYRTIARFAAEAAGIVGTYVHVVSDDVPAADPDSPAL